MLVLPIVAVVLASVLFDVRTLEGERFQAELQEWRGARLTFVIDQKAQSFSTEQLAQLTRETDPAAPSTPTSGLEVEFVDGSRAFPRSIQLRAGTMTIFQGTGAELECPVRQVRGVRFARQRERDRAWAAITSATYEDDAVIVRRGPDALDFLEGRIREIDERQVRFDLDGDPLEVPREKLEGVIFFPVPNVAVQPARFQVKTVSGDEWRALSAQFSTSEGNATRLAVVASCGIPLELDLDQIQEINFSAGNLCYLDSLKPEVVEVTPGLEFADEPTTVRQFLWEPKFNRSRFGEPLRLSVPGSSQRLTFEHGLALHSRTRLVYLLAEPYRALQGLAGLAPDAPPRAQAQLIVRTPASELFRQTLDRQSGPIEVRLSFPATTQLEIIVDPGADGSLGDWVHLCDFRLLK